MKTFSEIFDGLSLVESVWTDAQLRLDADLVSKFEKHFKARRIPNNINIQKIKTKEELEGYVEAANNKMSPEVFAEIKKEQEVGSQKILDTPLTKVYKVVKDSDADKLSNHNDEWCIVSNDHWSSYYANYKIYIIKKGPRFKQENKSHYADEPDDDGRDVWVQDPEYIIFPYCVLKNRKTGELEGWDGSNNYVEREGGGNDSHDEEFIKKYILAPLKIPTDLFK